MPKFNTQWVADYAVMTITIDEATNAQDAEDQSYRILVDYLGETADLFRCDEIEPYDGWLDPEDFANV